jgi:tRNA pseudouridine38-40 synthase
VTAPARPKSRFALWIWYRGDRFRGFQAQPQGPTVQQTIEEALAALGISASVAPAGRTDRGVHARMQVLSVRAPAVAAEELGALLAKRLPPAALGIALVKRPVPGFHAQWSSSGKVYRYRLALARPSPAWAPYCWEPASHARLGRVPVDSRRLAELLRRCEGERDFIAFHEKSSVRKPRRLSSATLVELGEGLFEVRLEGSGFARYQVRYLIGAVVLAAAGVLSEEALGAALDQAAPIHGLKAPAQGLVLWEVRYPQQLDPFSAAERADAPGVPAGPPFNGG